MHRAGTPDPLAGMTMATPPIAMAWAAGRRPDLTARLESMLGV